MTFKQLRAIGGVSQFELAREAGIGRWKIAEVEAGYRSLTSEEEAIVRAALVRIGKKRALAFQRAIARESVEV